MVGADETTELWRPPIPRICLLVRFLEEDVKRKNWILTQQKRDPANSIRWRNYRSTTMPSELHLHRAFQCVLRTFQLRFGRVNAIWGKQFLFGCFNVFSDRSVAEIINEMMNLKDADLKIGLFQGKSDTQIFRAYVDITYSVFSTLIGCTNMFSQSERLQPA